ncbi:hypothetical protein ACHHYP_13481 [Achlya hypogyna]|uniref:FYVE-type domain-containing protein n=1 Tax=Achlya hypogyna TaxID=1202772 RepID=A0A1V9YF76_ACHHY|nr:hypothetical protein ACHHYP_13481 [Achlya hypogyna]
MYPLRDDAFICPTPTPAQTAYYTHLGETIFDQFLESTLTKCSAVAWDHVASYNTVELYKGTSANGGKAFTKAKATIEEIAHIHSFETREQCRHFAEHYADDLLDMFTLYNFVPRTKADPFKQVYLKWTACASPIAGAVRNRDFTYLECQDAFETPAGRRGWAFCQLSVDLPFLPSFESTELGLVRGRLMRTGCVFVETETPGVVDVIYHICADLQGHIPHWTYKLGMKTRAMSVLHIEKNVHRLRLSATSLTGPKPSSKLPKPSMHCAVCTRPFRFHRVRYCQSCSKAVCSKCSHKYKLPDSETDPVRVCARCTEVVRAGPNLELTAYGCSTPLSESSSNHSQSWWLPETPTTKREALTSPMVDLGYLKPFGATS